jgi:prophage DNA circulation protein
MAWDDRIVDAIYTSPSGKEATFKFEELERTTPLKTGVFTFPDKDGAHVQHQGAGGKTHPFVCLFQGQDCMDLADEFEAMLIERGVAEFQHPAYGTLKVVPTGDIKRKDDLIKELNQSTVNITFTETIVDETSPALDVVTADNIDAMMEDFSEAAAEDFAAGLSADTVPEQLQAQSALTDQANAMGENLSGLAQNDPGKWAQFLTTMKELKSNIQGVFNKAEQVVQKGLNIARQTLNLMKAPSRMVVAISEKIKGYTGLITQIVGQFKNDPFGIKHRTNAFISTRLVLTGAVASMASGSALSIAAAASSAAASGISADASAGTMSREEAIDTALQIEALLETVKDFEDSKVELDVFIDSNGSAYFKLQELVFASAQLIMNAAFSLPMRRTITTDRDRQVIELCCELYGSEDYLDRFIRENNFSIDEIELISMGTEVTYYVQSA